MIDRKNTSERIEHNDAGLNMVEHGFVREGFFPVRRHHTPYVDQFLSNKNGSIGVPLKISDENQR